MIILLLVAVLVVFYFLNSEKICLAEKAFVRNKTSKLRVVTLNVKNTVISKEENLDPLKTLYPRTDIFALQEVSIPKVLTSREPEPNKIFLLEENITYKRKFISDWYALTFLHSNKNPKSAYNFGLAIGVGLNSGFKVYEKKIFRIGGTENKRIIALHGRMNGRLEILTIANMHGDWNGGFENKLNTEAIETFFEYMGNFKKTFPFSDVIFVGDLNLKKEQVLKLLPVLEKKYGTVLKSPTAKSELYSMGKNEKIIVDHVITDLKIENLSIPDIKIMNSDHFPVEVVFRLPYLVSPSHI